MNYRWSIRVLAADTDHFPATIGLMQISAAPFSRQAVVVRIASATHENYALIGFIEANDMMLHGARHLSAHDALRVMESSVYHLGFRTHRPLYRPKDAMKLNNSSARRTGR